MLVESLESTEVPWWESALLACPSDRAPLRAAVRQLRCSQCGRTFNVQDGIPCLFDHPLTQPSPPGGRGQGEGATRWRRAQRYELDFWDREDSSRREGRLAQNRLGAEGLARILDARVGVTWRRRALQIGPADQGEIHYLPAAERFALEPLAGELSRRNLLEPGVRWIAGQGERLPFPDHHFSLILITNVLDHVADPRAVLSEMRRCLSPDGAVWLTCHVSPAMVASAFRLLHGLGWGYFAGHLWYFTARRLDRLCRQAGFRRLLADTRRHVPAEFGCQGRLRRRLKPLLLQNRQLLLAAKPEGLNVAA